MKTSGKNSGVLLVAISAASFGLIPVFAKMAYSAGTSMYTLLFLRFLVATVFMFALMIIRNCLCHQERRLYHSYFLELSDMPGRRFAILWL